MPTYIYSKISESLSTRLDIARSLAALFVLLGHLRGSFFVAYPDLSVGTQNTFNYLTFFATRTGYECVIVFFVLSGFLVGGSYLTDCLQGTNDIKKYLVNRFSRMYAVLIPALVVTLLVNLCLLYLDSRDAVQNLNVQSFLGSLFFVQNIYVRCFGGNSPLWSLANEFWYYMLWPVFLYLTTINKSAIVKILLITTSIGLLYYIAPDIIRLFPLWVLGALLRFVPEMKRINNKLSATLIFALFFAAIAFSNIYKNFWGEYAVAITFSLVIMYWINNTTSINLTIKKWANSFASFSFSLYAIHYVLIQLFVVVVSKYFDAGIRLKSASLANWLIYLAFAGFLTFTCWLFYLISEKHTNLVRKWLYKKTIRI